MVQDGPTILISDLCGQIGGRRSPLHARLAALVDVPRLPLAWRAFLADRTEADFQAWREQQTWSADKHRRLQTIYKC
jgi:hypothetical protein